MPVHGRQDGRSKLARVYFRGPSRAELSMNWSGACLVDHRNASAHAVMTAQGITLFPLNAALPAGAGVRCLHPHIRLRNKFGWASVWISGQYLPFWEIKMPRRDDQDVHDGSDANCRVPANRHRPGPNRSSSASRLHLEPCGRGADRYRRTETEPTLDEVLREPVIRLMMKCDNITEDRLLHLIRTARRHMSESMSQASAAGSVAVAVACSADDALSADHRAAQD